jgi:hypothetical protein
MEAKELRKELRNGVYVHRVKDWGEPLNEIELVEWDEGIWYRIGECIAVLEDYEPIPLTAEWLDRFGFEEYKGDHSDTYIIKLNWHLSSSEFCYLLLSSSSHYWIGYSDDKHDNIDIGLGKMDFVHQLQNLYFAITGKELVLTAENGG